MEPKNTYNKNELLSMANGDMFGQENAQIKRQKAQDEIKEDLSLINI